MRCLVSAAERDGLKLIAVTINAPDDWKDHKTMLDYGFASYHKLNFVGEKEYSISLPVIGGRDQTVLLRNTDAITAILPSHMSSEDCEIITELPHFLYAPVEDGETVGKLICKAGGEIIGESDITAEYSVSRAVYKKSFWQRILDFFKGIFD